MTNATNFPEKAIEGTVYNLGAYVWYTFMGYSLSDKWRFMYEFKEDFETFKVEIFEKNSNVLSKQKELFSKHKGSV